MLVDTASTSLLLYSGVFLCFAFGTFFATSVLTESPPTWMDEGIILQVAQNLSSSGQYALQTAPDQFVSAAMVSTGYPVIFPIVVFFRLFGENLAVARSVMVIYLLAFLALVYVLSHTLSRSHCIALATLAVVVTFAPLYGHGKAVLGEVPGLFFILLALYAVQQIEQRQYSAWHLGLLAFASSLAIITKPIFIPFAPILFVYIYRRRGLLALRRGVALGACFVFIIPVALWISLQFQGESIAHMFAFYSNPYSVALVPTVMENLRRFTNEAQPLYAAILMLLWSGTVIYRWRKGLSFTASELCAFALSILVFAAYFRTVGYYRYFFPTQLLALIYLPHAFLTQTSSTRTLSLRVPLAFAAIAVVAFLQAYQTAAHSWVAANFHSTKSTELTLLLNRYDVETKFFLLQTPEVALFLPHPVYYQFMQLAPGVTIGDDVLRDLPTVSPDVIFTQERFLALYSNLLQGYTRRSSRLPLVVLERTPPGYSAAR